MTGSIYRSSGQRQARLLELLRHDFFLDVQSIQEKLGISPATARRDLTELESRGLIKRTHGGARAVNQVSHDYTAAVRSTTNSEEKQKIAEAAAELIVEGDAVMIDSGTTSLKVAELLAPNPTLTFVTNGANVLAALVAHGAKSVYMIGGEYIDINHSMGGPLAAKAVGDFHLDKAILSVSAVDLEREVICTLTPQIACVQAKMIEIAQTSIVVADYSKFERRALSVIAPLSDIDWVVTDQMAQPHLTPRPAPLRKKFIFA